MIQILTLLIMQLEDGTQGLLINFTECKIIYFASVDTPSSALTVAR